MSHHKEIWNTLRELVDDLDKRIVENKHYRIEDYKTIIARTVNYHIGDYVEFHIHTKKDKTLETEENQISGFYSYEENILALTIYHNSKNKNIKATLLLKQQIIITLAHELAHYYQQKYHPLDVPHNISKHKYTSQHHEIDAFALNIALSFVFTKRGINRIRYRNAIDVCDDLWWFYENATASSVRKLLKRIYCYYHKFKELQKYDRRKKVRTNSTI